MLGRLVIALVGLLLVGTSACGDSDDDDPVAQGTGGLPPASQPGYCDDLGAVRDSATSLEEAVQSGDREAARAAVEELRDDVVALRDSARTGEASNEVNQAAADLVGAVEGLETTVRQVEQGGANVTGVLQELETQLPAIATSIETLREEASCS